MIPREQKHFSRLRNGYPLEEASITDLRTEGIDTIIIRDGDQLYLVDVSQYQRGDRIGHDPYPMLRVVSLDDATRPLATGEDERQRRVSAWEWLTEHDLHPVRDRPTQSTVSSRSRDEQDTCNL